MLKEKYKHLLDITNHMKLYLYNGVCYKKTLILEKKRSKDFVFSLLKS